MKGEQENLFDYYLVKYFKIGDLVSWTNLGKESKDYGFIRDIYYERTGPNRKFAFAKVMKTNGAEEPFNLSLLTKESPENKDD